MAPIDSAPEESKPQDPIFIQSVFDELLTEYPKDPMRFTRVYKQLKDDTENPSISSADRAESCRNLCLLDFAVAELKAKSGDREAAKIMYADGTMYLERLETSNISQNLRTIKLRVMKEI
jgi:hypothetical protein